MASVKASRRDKAEATRLRILRAAQDEFTEKGYHGATMASIAARAGVATQTVYFVFHTKSAVIMALIDLLVMGEEKPEIPQETTWWAAMQQAGDAPTALRAFVRGAAPLLARASGMSEILRGASLTDDELRAAYEENEGLRAAGYREAMELIASKGALHEGLDVASATDLLLTVFGDSTYHLMTVERGWSHNRLVDWYCEALPRLLLAEP